MMIKLFQELHYEEVIKNNSVIFYEKEAYDWYIGAAKFMPAYFNEETQQIVRNIETYAIDGKIETRLFGEKFNISNLDTHFKSKVLVNVGKNHEDATLSYNLKRKVFNSYGQDQVFTHFGYQKADFVDINNEKVRNWKKTPQDHIRLENKYLLEMNRIVTKKEKEKFDTESQEWMPGFQTVWKFDGKEKLDNFFKGDTIGKRFIQFVNIFSSPKLDVTKFKDLVKEKRYICITNSKRTLHCSLPKD